jgi:hypothetical protein
MSGICITHCDAQNAKPQVYLMAYHDLCNAALLKLSLSLSR